jgi:uncharacterized protein YfdQ (DUF2303 family)
MNQPELQYQAITEAEKIAALAVSGVEIREAEHGAIPFVIVPNGYNVADLESMLERPRRYKGVTVVNDADSFAQVVKWHRDDDSTLYMRDGKFCCVFDDHGELPGWGQFVCVYECPESREWTNWTNKSGIQMKQAEFVHFIESNLPDIVVPDAASLLEVAKKFEVKKTVKFSSDIRLDNGQRQLEYVEEVQGSSQKGQMRVPAELVLGLAVHENGPLYEVHAHLRYRMDDGRLSIWFELIRPHKIIDDAMTQLRKKIEEDTGMKAINGWRHR